MAQHVLIPVDGSAHGFAGLEYAVASFPDATITAVCVVNPAREHVVELDSPLSSREALEERAANILERATERAANAGGECRTTIETGSPHTEILRLAVEEDVDHIVMGSHGESPITRPFLGRVSEAVVRRSPVSTTVVPETPAELSRRTLPGKILLPIDGSEQAEAALEFAVKTFPDGDHTALHVLAMTLDRSRDTVRGTYLEEVLADLENRGAKILSSATSLADEFGVTVETDTALGKPAAEIVAYAQTHEYDQIVMGSHGRSIRELGITGSIAERVVRRSPVTVTLVGGQPDEA
ncbi:universal stress protein [Halovivax gelatinilyticus]|uniref:universal stress protein n=1 Tax=Halovivax gelatinilyticus TaxID=2961597 RepID=UPI0020CA7F77|nr:universal stress protein [Halovivax gelatinilyticus]